MLWLTAIHSAQPALLYESGNLEDYAAFAECNPGGTTKCPCGPSDVKVTQLEGYGQVTANVRGTYSFVNAIARHTFYDRFTLNEPITQDIYAYEGEVQLPYVPRPAYDRFYSAQAVHIMMQRWDGRTAARTTQEAVLYWHLNAWTPEFGRVSVYTGQPAVLRDTGLTLTPDTAWHTFRLVADFAANQYVSLTIDGVSVEVRQPLAAVYHPDWRPDNAFTLTAESENAWPGAATCPTTFGWITRFREMKLWREFGPDCQCIRSQ